MKDDSTTNIRFLAAAIADCMMDGLTLDELRKLYAIVTLINENIRAAITLKGLIPIVPPIRTPPIAPRR